MKETVEITVTRPLPRDGITHPVGAVIEVPVSALEGIEGANPPYGKRKRSDELTIEDLNATADASEDARALANEIGLDLRGFSGLGSGPNGRAWLDDVRGWAARKDS